MSEYTLALGTIVVGALAYAFLRGRDNAPPTMTTRSVDTTPPDFEQDVVHAEAPKSEAPPPGPEPEPIDDVVHVQHEELHPKHTSNSENMSAYGMKFTKAEYDTMAKGGEVKIPGFSAAFAAY